MAHNLIYSIVLNQARLANVVSSIGQRGIAENL